MIYENMDYIYEVYKEGSFSRAARNLFISQPSLSASVKRVEDRIGYPVFDRSTKPLRLTEVGRQYVKGMLAVKEAERNFTDFLNDYGELKTGSLKLGGTNLVSSLVAPGIINKFRQKYPQIIPELLEGTTADLQDMLFNGHLDMVIDYTTPDPEIYDSVELTEEQLILTVPVSFPVNRSLEEYRISISDLRGGSGIPDRVPAVPLENFREVPFVLLKKKNDSYERALKICAEAGFDPQVSFEAEQQMTAYHVCNSQLGAAFVSSLLLSRVAPSPEIVCYRTASPLAHRKLRILWKKERYLTRSMAEFRNLAIKEFSSPALSQAAGFPEGPEARSTERAWTDSSF